MVSGIYLAFKFCTIFHFLSSTALKFLWIAVTSWVQQSACVYYNTHDVKSVALRPWNFFPLLQQMFTSLLIYKMCLTVLRVRVKALTGLIFFSPKININFVSLPSPRTHAHNFLRVPPRMIWVVARLSVCIKCSISDILLSVSGGVKIAWVMVKKKRRLSGSWGQSPPTSVGRTLPSPSLTPSSSFSSIYTRCSNLLESDANSSHPNPLWSRCSPSSCDALLSALHCHTHLHHIWLHDWYTGHTRTALAKTSMYKNTMSGTDIMVKLIEWYYGQIILWSKLIEWPQSSS